MGRRLKDADALIELIDDDIASLDKIDMSREGYDVCLCTLQMVKLYIKVLPAVEAVPLEDYRSMEQTVYKLTQALADAEPIVRCKDCKYSTPLTFYDKGVKGLFCNYRGSIGDWRYRTTDDFCSRGERRENVNSDTDTDDL